MSDTDPAVEEIERLRAETAEIEAEVERLQAATAKVKANNERMEVELATLEKQTAAAKAENRRAMRVFIVGFGIALVLLVLFRLMETLS